MNRFHKQKSLFSHMRLLLPLFVFCIMFLLLSLLAAVSCPVFGLTWSMAVLLVFVVYVLMNVITAIFRV